MHLQMFHRQTSKLPSQRNIVIVLYRRESSSCLEYELSSYTVSALLVTN